MRLAELVAAFSLASDLGLGQPMEHVLRSWRIASRLGDYVEVEPGDGGALYYTATLAWVGCVADTPEVATWFGDDIAFRGDSFEIDFAGLPAMAFMVRHAGVAGPRWTGWVWPPRSSPAAGGVSSAGSCRTACPRRRSHRTWA